MRVSEDLPKVLIIDDQFGRWTLGPRFRAAVGADVFAMFEADRDNLCRNFGLVFEGALERIAQPVAVASFCPAQVWNDDTQVIENAPGTVFAAVSSGWPFADGTRWSLVLLDLRFTFGRLNVFGDPEEGTQLGSDVLLPRLRAQFGHDLPIVVLSSLERQTVNTQVRQLGALDFIQRVPGAGAPPEESRRALREALNVHGLLPDPSGSIVGTSLPILTMLRAARRAARSARTILLEGETGVGKGLLARYIHTISDRNRAPFEVFSAAQTTPELQADHLFGHWRGAFTGASSDSPGLWERAAGGTLFIDEVADLDESVQARLMRPIEERRVRRLGHAPTGQPAEVEVDVVVILATNRKLEEGAGFKKDFRNRVDAFVIEVPPLRERRGDIPLLADRLARTIRPEWNGRILPDAMATLQDRDWSGGNVRELRNVLERALTNNPTQDIAAPDLAQPEPIPVPVAGPGRPGWTTPVAAFVQHRLTSPRAFRVGELQELRGEVAGFFADLIAESIAWALAITATEGRVNHTAAVRLLLGRHDIGAMEAKRFLKKALALDAHGGSVWKRFARFPGRPTSDLLEDILGALANRAGRLKHGGDDLS